MVEDSISPLAFTSLSPVVSSPDAILRRGVRRCANAHQRVADKRVDTKTNTGGAQQFKAVRKHHHPAFRETVRHLSDKRSENNVSTHKHHLQDGLAPVWIKLGLQQCGGKQ